MTRFLPSTRTRSRTVAAAVATVAMAVALPGCAVSEAGPDDRAASQASVLSPELRAEFPGTEASGPPIKIGLINSEGGDTVNQPDGRLAAEAVADYANDHLGGLAGREIELVVCRNKESSAGAADCANRMVEERVVGVVVPSTGTGSMMAPIISDAGIAYTTPYGTAVEEYQSANSFVWTSSLPGQMAAMARYSADSGATSAVLFQIDVGGVVDVFKALGEPAFRAAGVDFTVIPIPAGTPDVTPQVAAGLIGNPDVVITIADESTCVAVMNGLVALGDTTQRYMGSTCAQREVIDTVGSAAFEGAKTFPPHDVVTDDIEAQLYRAVMSEYAPDVDLSGDATTGYQAMLTFIRAAGDVQGEPTQQGVVEAISASDGVKLAIGHGATLDCSRTAIEGFPAICGRQGLVGTIANSEIASFEVVSF